MKVSERSSEFGGRAVCSVLSLLRLLTAALHASMPHQDTQLRHCAHPRPHSPGVGPTASTALFHPSRAANRQRSLRSLRPLFHSMSASSPALLSAGGLDEVKQPTAPSSLYDSVVVVDDGSRLRPVDPSVVLSTSHGTAPSVHSAAADDGAVGEEADPFGPPADEWAAASSSSTFSSTSPLEDPFASSDAGDVEVASSSPDAFAAFPKPGHVEEHAPLQDREGRKKSSKKKKKKAAAAAAGSATTAATEARSALPSLPASLPSAVFTEPASGGGRVAEDDSGLLMADSAEYVAMLEQRLERLKKKQEARIKAAAAKTTRRTSHTATHPTAPNCHPSAPCKPPAYCPLRAVCVFVVCS